MKIIIPMAGNGNRFAQQGYRDPKPFINVNGKPMIRQVVDHLGLQSYEHIFLCRTSHLENYSMSTIFYDIKFQIVKIDTLTEGAAISVSMAKNYIDPDEDILIVNSDQLLHYNLNDINAVRNSDVDGCIWCFKGTGTNWSYARLNEHNNVVEVAEKRQISEYATGGMYYWRSMRTFLESTRRMVAANDRTNNEFYVAPVYNYINSDSKVIIKMLDKVEQLGTPGELSLYLNH
jgi:NDP-sugar pyrophosphorylase family protein